MNSNPKVFVVDDDEIYLFTIKRVFQGVDKSIEDISHYSDGQSLLEFFKSNINIPENIPDMILLDINMPIMNGWEFLEEFEYLLEEMKKKVNIFIISSSIFTEDLVKYKNFKFLGGYYVKPIFENDLKEMLIKTGF